MMCSVCGHRFTTPLFGVRGDRMSSFGGPPMYSYELTIDTYGLFVTVFEVFSWLQKRFRPFARPSDPDTITDTALEATPSSGGKNC